MKQLDSIQCAHPKKIDGFNMRTVKIYIYSKDKVVSVFPRRKSNVQSMPDYFCECHIPDLDFVDTQGYLMSLMKRVNRERMDSAKGYKFEANNA